MRPCVDVVISSAGPPAEVADELAARLDRHADDTVTVVERTGRDGAARAGRAPWIVLLDAEVDAPSDLVDRLFARTPRSSTAILAGAVGERTTIGLGRDARAQEANCAVRRIAFDAAGGGGPDLSARLRALGWSLERREEARVERRAPVPDAEAPRTERRQGRVARTALVALLAASAVLVLVLVRRVPFRTVAARRRG